MGNKTAKQIIEKVEDFAIIKEKLVRSHALWKTNRDPIEKDIIVGFRFYSNGKLKEIKTWGKDDAPKGYRDDYYIAWDEGYGSASVFLARDIIVFGIASQMDRSRIINDYFN